MYRIFLVLLINFSVVSISKAQPLSLEKQRDIFEAAEYEAKRGRYKAYSRSVARIKDYPLAPYAELAYLKRRPYLVNKTKIRNFLNLYTGTPLEWPLRKAWLLYLGKKHEHVLFLNDFKPTQNAELNCYRLRAELGIGAKLASIEDEISELWVVGKSQPKACDPLFKRWNDAGYRTHEHIKDRIKLAATKGKHNLIPYLTSLLPQKERRFGHLWLKLRRDPSTVTRLSQFKYKNTDEAEMIAYAIKRSIWKNIAKTLTTWTHAQTEYPFTDEQVLAVNKKLALALASKGDLRAEPFFDVLPVNVLDGQLAHWRLSTLLQNERWYDVIDFVDALPAETHEELAFQYWKARAQEKIGLGRLAEQSFKRIAKERHYYGFLASAQVNQLAKINNYPYQAHYKALDDIAQAPAAKRAFELLQLGRITQARREWWHFKRSLTKDEKATAAILASRWEWHDQALSTISQAGYLDDVRLRFPLAYEGLFEAYAKQHKIPSTLAFAIARRESSFMADANSSAGARGLMQLMPGTAKMVAGKSMSKRKLIDPATNIRLGTQYISQLIKRLNGNTPLAIASYNAGYNRVIKWIPTDKAMSFDLWVETIPYKETREYVKAVLAYQQVYEQLIGQNENVFSPLVSKKIKMAK